MEAHPEYRACVSFWQAFNERGLIPNRVVVIPERPRVFKWYLLLRGQSIHSTACIERTALIELGGYRELPLSQDYRLWCDLTRRGWLGIVPEVLSYVRMHEGRVTNKKPGLQQQLALQVLDDHVYALTGDRWSNAELSALWAVGYSLAMPVRQGLAMLDRWDGLWRADPALDKQDREDLMRLSSLRRWKHLRANARQQPARVLMDAIKLGAANLCYAVGDRSALFG